MNIYYFYNGQLALICFFIYILMLIHSRGVFCNQKKFSSKYRIIFIYLSVYSILGFLEWDTYHYAWLYDQMRLSSTKIHVEDFYFWLLKFLPENFLLWRSVIWGTASVFMILSAKLLKLNSYTFCLASALIFIGQLTVTRGGLGLSLMMFCLVFFFQKKDLPRIFRFILSAFGLYLCIYLHSSMFIFIVLLFLALAFPFNKKTVYLSLFMFPILYMFIIGFINSFLESGTLSSEQESFITTYNDGDKSEFNLLGTILVFLQNSSLILLMLFMIKKFVYEHITDNRILFILFKYSYILIYLSLLFSGQNTSSWISSRLFHAATFSIVLTLPVCLDNSVSRKGILFKRLVIALLLFISMWNQLYFIYKNWQLVPINV